jgi:hypothetical protein
MLVLLLVLGEKASETFTMEAIGSSQRPIASEGRSYKKLQRDFFVCLFLIINGCCILSKAFSAFFINTDIPSVNNKIFISRYQN